jgi:hypothetical protein
MSPLWLLLIIPGSFIAGFFIMALLVAASKEVPGE